MKKGEPEKPEKILKPSLKARIAYLLLVIFFVSLSVYCYLKNPLSWEAFASYFCVAIGIGGLLEIYQTRTTIYQSHIEIIHSFKRSQIMKNEIEKVTWEKCCSASVLLKNGEWISVPAYGITNQGMCNTLRAWLKKS